MKNKKMLTPLVLILSAFLLGNLQVKAHAPVYKPVWVYYETNVTFVWDITYHNTDTNVDYTFNTSNVTDGQSGAQIGLVPVGNYTVTLTNLGAYADYFDLQAGSASAIVEDDSVHLSVDDSHTMSGTVVVADTDSESDVNIYNY